MFAVALSLASVGRATTPSGEFTPGGQIEYEEAGSGVLIAASSLRAGGNPPYLCCPVATAAELAA